MKNVLKTLGIMCVIGAALFITACGPGEETDPTFTVTFDSDGGSAVSAQPNIAKDGFATEPTPPTKAAGAAPAKPSATTLYKLGTAAPTFGGWYLPGDTTPYDFSTPVTKNITLKAKWTEPATGGTTSVALTGSGDDVAKAISTVNSGGNTDKYVLYLAADVNPATASWVLQKGELTIDSTSTTQRTIKSLNLGTGSGATNMVYITIGATATAATPPTLTLKNIKLQGSGTATGDSLVRIVSGGTLILDTNTVISDHKNSSTSSGGDNGNGSAVCVYGGNLTMKVGAVIENNESTADTNTTNTKAGNKNRVGGVYTYVPPSGHVNLNINGGIIEGNKCTNGNTKDLYATEGGIFTLGGNVTIGELTINADVPSNVNQGVTTTGNAAQAVPAIIVVSGLANQVGSLNLRTTGAADTASTLVKAVWVGKQVLSGTLDNAGAVTAPAYADVQKFTLGRFMWNGGNAATSGFEDIGTGYEIGSDGIFKVKATPSP